MPMFGRKPRDARRSAKQDAWISNGGFATRKCTLLDISNRGAKLKIEDPLFLQNQFTLKLSRHEPVGRSCRIVWRKGALCGVEFLQ